MNNYEIRASMDRDNCGGVLTGFVKKGSYM